MAEWFLAFGRNAVTVPSGSGSPEGEAMMFGCSTSPRRHELGIIDQHYALIIIPLLITQAPKCFGINMPSSGSVLYLCELLERQKWLCCSRAVKLHWLL
jgi:hypothetical protein